MTENEEVEVVKKTSIVEDFKALTTKQIIAIIGTMVACLVMVYFGYVATMCMGFLVIAVLLYMIPHILGVSSPYVKGITGIVFVLIAVLICCFAYSDVSADYRENIPLTNEVLLDIGYEDGEVYMDMVDPAYIVTKDTCAPVTVWAFGIAGIPSNTSPANIPLHFVYDETDGMYYADADLKEDYYYIAVTVSCGDKSESAAICINNGLPQSAVVEKNTVNSLMYIVYLAAVYFILLVVSALVRRSAKKTRAKLENDGRLYPVGYDKCKNCGTMVLPGEIVCRKCGAPIEVPEEIKVLHKKDFFECSECGTEVPLDAKFCPKCGVKFDEDTENVIKHADGTVDTSTDTFECSECGKTVPANAKRCPYCGAEFDEEDE